MFLKNYTSEVPVSQTIYRIEQVLIRCGVLGIAKEYKGTSGEISAITFRISDNGREFQVRMPADSDKALDAMWLNYANGCPLTQSGQNVAYPHDRKKKKSRSDFAEQANRTAWKIIQDWVEVQMSMIQMRQAEPIEVFLPYVWDGKSTVFNRIKGSGYRALLPEKSESTT